MEESTLIRLLDLAQEAERNVVIAFPGASAGYVDHKVEEGELVEATFVLDRLSEAERRALQLDADEDLLLIWSGERWKVCAWDGQPRYEDEPGFEHASDAVRMLMLELATRGMAKLRGDRG